MPPTSLELDVLMLVSSIYAADLLVQRGDRELVTRDIRVIVPVVNLPSFRGIRSKLEVVLYLMSGDNWTVDFVQENGMPEIGRQWAESDGISLLFSGGLDSLAEAVHLVDLGQPLVLVSHDSGNHVTRTSQNDLRAYLMGLPNRGLSTSSFHVQLAGNPGEREISQRTRSVLFLGLATIAARRSGFRRIVFIAENGPMAIHLPLTRARIGSFSTHTAKPEVVSTLQEIFSTIFGVGFQFENPFLYSTKAEIVEGLCREHPSAVSLSTSCWRGSRIPGNLHHCGECVPCLVRRISLEHNGLFLQEWNRDLLVEDVLALPEEDIGKRNLVELAEFAVQFTSGLSDNELALKFPDLVSDDFDQGLATMMYRRFAAEVVQVLNRYPQLKGMLV